MINAKQLAQMAGVSRGTVDRVLHDRGGVNPETARRIRQIAQEWGYIPSRAGKALVTKCPVTIGVVMSSVGNPFFRDVLQGMQDAVGDFADFPVEISLQELQGYDAAAQAAALDALRGQKVRGILLTPINHPLIVKALDCLMQDQIPVITVNNDIQGSRRLYVGCNDDIMGRTAGKLMGMMTGGRGCALAVVGSLSLLGHAQRWQGFRAALQAEYAAMEALVIENGDDDDQSCQAVAAMLRTHPEIDSVYFAAAGARGGIRACQEKISPDHIILTDDTEEIRSQIRQGNAAATICQQPYLQGYQAMKMLLQEVLMGQISPQNTWFTQCEIKLRYHF